MCEGRIVSVRFKEWSLPKFGLFGLSRTIIRHSGDGDVSLLESFLLYEG